MKKKKLMIILGSVSISIITIVLIVVFSLENSYVSQKNRDYYVSMLNDNYWKITHNEQYYSFVEHYEEEITKPASEQSKQEFDNLYSKDDATTGWNNYSSLEHDLTTKELSPTVTIDVNWTNLFKQVHLNDETIKQGENKLFHYYNIIANLYAKDNILKLLQYAKMDNDPEKMKSTFGYIKHFRFLRFYPAVKELNQQIMGLGAMFADQGIMTKNYNVGFGATDDLISTIVHEYGHAISFFLGSDPSYRQVFNDEPWPTTTTKLQKQKLVKINDCTDLLCDCLNNEANIGSDSIKREFFPLIVVRSNYGRSYWFKDTDKWKQQKDEFFAEAFDQWLDTPKNDRTWNWQLLNDFFTKKLPHYFK